MSLTEKVGALNQKIGPRKYHVEQALKTANDLIQEYLVLQEQDYESYLKNLRKVQLKVQEHWDIYTNLREETENTILGGQDPDEKDTLWKKYCDTNEEFFKLEDKKVDLLSEIKATVTAVQAKMEAKIALGAKRVDADYADLKKQIDHLEEELKKKKSEVPGKPSSKTSVKLPRLKLPMFTGNILKWREFYQMYEAIVTSEPDISNVEKFNLLKMHLDDKAKEVIEGIPATGENFEKALKLLQARYENTQKLAAAHFTALNDLPMCDDDTFSLRATFTQMEIHLRSLESLGKPVDSEFILHSLLKKIPKKVIISMSEKREKKDESWNVDSFRKTLEIVIKDREFADTYEEPLSEPPVSTLHASRKSYHRRNLKCAFCFRSHYNDECDKYTTFDSRKARLPRGCCMKCFSTQHKTQHCTKNITCFHCGNAHNRALCMKHLSNIQRKDTTAVNTSSLVANGTKVLLQTALARLINPGNKMSKVAHILLDPGSQYSYVSREMANQLQLRRKMTEYIDVSSFGTSCTQQKKTFLTDVDLKLANGKKFSMEASIVDVITSGVSRAPIDNKAVKKLLYKYQLADTLPKKHENVHIDMLIGSDFYWQLIKPNPRKEVSKGLYLIPSKLGWLITGRVSTKNYHSHSVVMLSHSAPIHQALPHENDFMSQGNMIEDFWNLETLGIKESPEVEDDDIALQRFENTVKYDNDSKRYFVAWPWKENPSKLPDNYLLAKGRLQSVVKRLSRDKELMTKYDSIIKDQLQKGVIEPVPQCGTEMKNRGGHEMTNSGGTEVSKCGGQGVTNGSGHKVTNCGGHEVSNCSGAEGSDSIVHYLSHLCVLAPGRSTKVRICYDGSAKAKKSDPSLNELLYRGPILLPDLCSLIFRFRLHKIGITADISKAFLQVGLLPNSKDCTRFLWLRDCSNPNLEGNIQEYRFTRVIFGVISSPHLLASVIHHHMNKMGTPVAQEIKDHMYVDNLLTGKNYVKLAEKFYKEAKSLFSLASMNICQWASNSKELMSKIPECDKVENTQIVSVLGYSWHTEGDYFTVRHKHTFEHTQNTKRAVLGFLSSIFDPCGFLSPLLIRGKILLQSLWLKKLDWDEEMCPSDIETWKGIREAVRGITEIPIPRYIGGNAYTLLCCCDSSELAYSAVVYLITMDGSKIQLNLVFSKSRVCPISKKGCPFLDLNYWHLS